NRSRTDIAVCRRTRGREEEKDDATRGTAALYPSRGKSGSGLVHSSLYSVAFPCLRPTCPRTLQLHAYPVAWELLGWRHSVRIVGRRQKIPKSETPPGLVESQSLGS